MKKISLKQYNRNYYLKNKFKIQKNRKVRKEKIKLGILVKKAPAQFILEGDKLIKKLKRMAYCREYSKKWSKENKDKRILYRHQRRALEKNLILSYTIKEWHTMKKRYNFSCLRCKKQEPEIKLTVDHIIPLKLGGVNTIDNIQPLCNHCNSLKHLSVVNYR